MTDRRPTVSIGLPIFNAERFLDEALDSLLAQDFADFEIILADNASTDRTPEICERRAASDPRISYLPSDRNRGLAWNHNRVVDAARAPFFKWAAYDDLYEPSFVSRCLAALAEQPDAVLAYTGTIDIDADGVVTKKWPATDRASSTEAWERFRDVVLNERQCFPIYGLMRTDVLRRTGLMGAFPSSDEPLLAELALHGRFVEVHEPLFLHREHPGRSMALYPSARARQAFYNPGSRRVTFPLWRGILEFALIARRSPLSVRGRRRAYSVVGRRIVQHPRWLILDVLGGIRSALRMARERLFGSDRR